MSSLSILQRWCTGNCPTPEDVQSLFAETLANPRRAQAFGITPEEGKEKIETRSQIFLTVYPEVRQLCQELGLQQDDAILTTLWELWLPWAMQLADARQALDRPLIQGILGGQGTGKTTLTEISRLILRHLDYVAIGVSIDDLYKTYAERQRLKQEDPRLIWRGPPGTHDVNVGMQLLDQVRQGNPQDGILIPRFDKSLYQGAGDRVESERVDEVDILLFEGWFIGARPLDEAALANPPEPINSPEDRQFARDSNDRLKAYLPLWQKLDRLMILYPRDYRLSKEWRKEAEHKMIAAGKSGMSDEEIDRFVEYFWCALHPDLFIIPLTQNAELVDLVIEIKRDHSLGNIHQPARR